MKKKSKIIIFLWALLILIPIGSYFIKDNTKVTPGLSYKNNNLEITEYNVSLDVDDNNKIDVIEEITINLKEEINGIYKTIPTWIEYNTKDGKKSTRKIEISNVHVNGEKFFLSKNNKSYDLRIGSERTTLEKGLHKFAIKYRFNMGKDPNKGFDELIFPLFEQYENSTIKSANITINMPKNFDKKKVSFSNKNIKYDIKDNVITASIDKEFNKSVILDIELPEKYFVRGTNNYGVFSLLVSIITVLVSILIAVLWYKKGKDFTKRSETVEFYPPMDYDAAQIGFIYGETNYKKLTLSLIVGLANKGYLSINKEKKDYILTNLINNFDNLDNKTIRVIEVTKVKNSDNNLNMNEKHYLDKLFFNTKKYITNNFDNFYKEALSLKNKGYITVTDSVREITPELSQEIKQKSNIDENLSITEQIVYRYLFKNGNTFNLSKENINPVIEEVQTNLNSLVLKKVNDKKATSLMRNTIITTIILIIAWMISYLIVYDMNPKFELLYYISYAVLFITSFICIIMDRRTPYGEEIIAKINGFKNYLEVAEKDTLDNQVEKNPNYFYNIVPYTYALGVSNKWIEMIDKATNKNIDVNNYDYVQDETFESIE